METKYCPIAKEECLRDMCMWYMPQNKKCTMFVIGEALQKPIQIIKFERMAK